MGIGGSDPPSVIRSSVYTQMITEHPHPSSVTYPKRDRCSSCVPSGCILPLSFQTFHCQGNSDSGSLIPDFISGCELLISLMWVFHNQLFFLWSCYTWLLVKSCISLRSPCVFGNPTLPLGVCLLHTSIIGPKSYFLNVLSKCHMMCVHLILKVSPVSLCIIVLTWLFPLTLVFFYSVNKIVITNNA